MNTTFVPCRCCTHFAPDKSADFAGMMVEVGVEEAYKTVHLEQEDLNTVQVEAHLHESS